jgi:hypothetical protein
MRGPWHLRCSSSERRLSCRITHVALTLHSTVPVRSSSGSPSRARSCRSPATLRRAPSSPDSAAMAAVARTRALLRRAWGRRAAVRHSAPRSRTCVLPESSAKPGRIASMESARVNRPRPARVSGMRTVLREKSVPTRPACRSDRAAVRAATARPGRHVSRARASVRGDVRPTPTVWRDRAASRALAPARPRAASPTPTAPGGSRAFRARAACGRRRAEVVSRTSTATDMNAGFERMRLRRGAPSR